MGVVLSRKRQRAAPPRMRRAPATLTTWMVCPTCGQAHRSPAEGGLSGLDERALRILRASALDELASAVCGGAGDEHIANVLRVLERCEERLALG